MNRTLGPLNNKSSTKSRGALVYKSLGSTAASGTPLAISFFQEQYDTDNIHDTDSLERRKLTVPIGVTKVQLSAQVAIEANAGGTIRELSILTPTAFIVGEATTQIYSAGGFSASRIIYVTVITAIIEVSSGDYFEAYILQDSGTALDIVASSSTWFCMEIIE